MNAPEYETRFGQGELNAQIDVEQLMDDIELDEEEIAWRKNFINFDEQDERTLEVLAPLFEAHAEDVAASFYDHVSEYGQTQAIIDRSPKSIEDLELTQQAYLITLVAGEYDEEYFRNRARIGKLHDMLDMPLHFYIGQYNVYYNLLLSLITDRIHGRIAATVEEVLDRAESGDDASVEVTPRRMTRDLYEDVEEGLDELHSLLKLLNLDMQVAVDTYLQSQIDNLEIERDRFAALFENVPTPVVIVRIRDESMRVEQVNTAFEEIFGYTAEELADKNFEQYLTPPDAEATPIENRELVASIEGATESKLSEAEITLETQFGRREFIRVAAPIDSPGYDDLEYAFYIDVTDQKQQQERLQVLSRVLRHDIRNQMTAVKGFASTLTEPLDKQQRHARVTRIVDSADELIEKSETIRTVQKLISGNANRRPMDLSNLIEDVVNDIRKRYPDCEFSSSTPSETYIRGTDALELAIGELVENAAKHNDSTNPRVEVRVTESADDEYTNIYISDNGPGIPPIEYEVLTGERDRSQIDHLSGLGLWTVNWIVTQIGGGLQFSENSPQGSTVILSFRPVNDSTAPADNL